MALSKVYHHQHDVVTELISKGMKGSDIKYLTLTVKEAQEQLFDLANKMPDHPSFEESRAWFGALLESSMSGYGRKPDIDDRINYLRLYGLRDTPAELYGDYSMVRPEMDEYQLRDIFTRSCEGSTRGQFGSLMFFLVAWLRSLDPNLYVLWARILKKWMNGELLREELLDAMAQSPTWIAGACMVYWFNPYVEGDMRKARGLKSLPEKDFNWHRPQGMPQLSLFADIRKPLTFKKLAARLYYLNSKFGVQSDPANLQYFKGGENEEYCKFFDFQHPCPSLMQITVGGYQAPLMAIAYSYMDECPDKVREQVKKSVGVARAHKEEFKEMFVKAGLKMGVYKPNHLRREDEIIDDEEFTAMIQHIQTLEED